MTDDRRIAEPTDEALMARVQAADQDALGPLFERYSQKIRWVVARILRDAAEAEDVVQDLFLFIQRKARIFDSSKSSARSWIIQMAYHRAIDRRRYLASRQYYAQTDIQDDRMGGPGNRIDVSEYSADAVLRRGGIRKVMESLSEDQRETIRLFFFDGYTIAEIAAKLGQPAHNIRHHYYRGLEKLRKQMCEGKKV